MKPTRISSLNELNAFIERNQTHETKSSCYRENETYFLKIEAGYNESHNKDMMLLFMVVETALLQFRIDSEKFLHAHSNLKIEEQLPKTKDIDHPFFDFEGLHERYMTCFVEAQAKTILSNLKEFNGNDDNYSEIARLAVKSRGKIKGMMFGY